MIPGMSTYVRVVTSPATCTCPVVIRVSTATRLPGSSLIMASRMTSLIWSAILSGWPSVTDSEVNRRRATSFLLVIWNAGEFIRTYPPRGAARQSCLAADVGLPGSAKPLLPKSCGHQVPHHVGEGIFWSARDLGNGTVGTVDDSLVVDGPEAKPISHRVDDKKVTPLTGQLSLSGLGGGIGLGGEPHEDLASGVAAPGQPGQNVRVLGQQQWLRRLTVLLHLAR